MDKQDLKRKIDEITMLLSSIQKDIVQLPFIPNGANFASDKINEIKEFLTNSDSYEGNHIGKTKHENIKVGQVSVEYTQPSDDSALHSDDIQTLTIQTEDAGAGTYYVLKTERFAIDNIAEMYSLLKDFESRIYSPQIKK